MDRPARNSTGRIDAYLGARVRDARQEHDITQEQLAAMMQFYGSESWRAATVAAVETGRRNLSLTEVANLCSILRVNLAQLAGGDVDVQSQPGLWALVSTEPRDTDPLVLDADKVSDVIRHRQLVRLEDAVLEKVTGRTHLQLLGEGWREQVLLAIEQHFGHDLLTERDQRVADGQGTKTWVSRRLSDEVAEIPGVIELVALFNMKGEGR